MLNERASGVLLHISSLPSKYGIGCFDKCAYDFVDFLQAAGQTYWQILPLCPTTIGDSPYQSISTFALNEYFIDLDALGRLPRSMTKVTTTARIRFIFFFMFFLLLVISFSPASVRLPSSKTFHAFSPSACFFLLYLLLNKLAIYRLFQTNKKHHPYYIT